MTANPRTIDFYKMCEQDNMIILEISEHENVKIPHMNIQNLKDILFKRLKLNKTCDIYKLSVEHLRYAGEESRKGASIDSLVNTDMKTLKLGLR